MEWVNYTYPYLAKASGGFYKFYFDLHGKVWNAIIERDELIIVFSRHSFNSSDDAVLVLTHLGMGWIKMRSMHTIVKEIL